MYERDVRPIYEWWRDIQFNPQRVPGQKAKSKVKSPIKREEGSRAEALPPPSTPPPGSC